MFNPYGFPFIMQSGSGSNNEDPFEAMRKTLEFVDKVKEEAKKEAEGKKDKDKDKDNKSLFTMAEWFILLLVTSSCVQTVILLWLAKGR